MGCVFMRLTYYMKNADDEPEVMSITAAKKLLKSQGGFAWTEHYERDGTLFETTEVNLKVIIANSNTTIIYKGVNYMSYGGIKNYNLVLLDFEISKYFVFKYQKDRRLTANQAWAFMRDNKAVIEGVLNSDATICDYDIIVSNHELNLKYSDSYFRFKGFR